MRQYGSHRYYSQWICYSACYIGTSLPTSLGQLFPLAAISRPCDSCDHLTTPLLVLGPDRISLREEGQGGLLVEVVRQWSCRCPAAQLITGTSPNKLLPLFILILPKQVECSACSSSRSGLMAPFNGDWLSLVTYWEGI